MPCRDHRASRFSPSAFITSPQDTYIAHHAEVGISATRIVSSIRRTRTRRIHRRSPASNSTHSAKRNHESTFRSPSRAWQLRDSISDTLRMHTNTSDAADCGVMLPVTRTSRHQVQQLVSRRAAKACSRWWTRLGSERDSMHAKERTPAPSPLPVLPFRSGTLVALLVVNVTLANRSVLLAPSAPIHRMPLAARPSHAHISTAIVIIRSRRGQAASPMTLRQSFVSSIPNSTSTRPPCIV